MPTNRKLTLASSLFLLAALLLLGPFAPLDLAGGAALDRWRLAHPAAGDALAALTFAGSALFLLPLAGAAALFARRRAAALLATVLSARLLVEALKWLIDRPRPDFSLHPVVVHSASLPSGHAANSMATYLALALFAAPERHRRAAIAAAVAASLVVGATRPLLGVHWTSDVLAGWALGLAVAAAALSLSKSAA